MRTNIPFAIMLLILPAALYGMYRYMDGRSGRQTDDRLTPVAGTQEEDEPPRSEPVTLLMPGAADFQEIKDPAVWRVYRCVDDFDDPVDEYVAVTVCEGRMTDHLNKTRDVRFTITMSRDDIGMDIRNAVDHINLAMHSLSFRMKLDNGQEAGFRTFGDYGTRQVHHSPKSETSVSGIADHLLSNTNLSIVAVTEDPQRRSTYKCRLHNDTASFRRAMKKVWIHGRPKDTKTKNP